MASPDNPIVSLPAERERTIEELSLHFAHDNLTLEELERRLELAYRATSVAELRTLTSDIKAATREPEPSARSLALTEPAPEHGINPSSRAAAKPKAA